MSGTSDGSTVDSEKNIDRDFSSFTSEEIKEIFITNPFKLYETVKKVINDGNPELAIFIIGILAARTVEPLLNLNKSITDRDFQLNRDYRAEYISSLNSVMELIAPIIKTAE